MINQNHIEQLMQGFDYVDAFERMDLEAYRDLSAAERLTYKSYLALREYHEDKKGILEDHRTLLSVLKMVAPAELTKKVVAENREKRLIFRAYSEAAAYFDCSYQKIHQCIRHNKGINGFNLSIEYI